MSNRLEHLLQAWGAHNIIHGDHANEFGENILYAAGVLQGRVQDSGHSSSKVLCEERSKDVRDVDRAINKLDSRIHKAVLYAWYCSLVKEDGTTYTEGQISNKLRMSLSAFRDQLRDAKKALRSKM